MNERASAVGLEDLLQRSGVLQVNQVSIDDTLPALQRLRQLARGLDKAQLVLLRRRTIDHLKSADCADATRLFDAVFDQSGNEDTASQGSVTIFPKETPWTVEVDGERLLDEVEATFERYLYLPRFAAAAMALWVLHTYVVFRLQLSPRLIFTSPTKRSGKTTALKILAGVVHKPLATSNTSAAAVLRIIEQEQPTLLIDEADTFVRDDQQLVGVLNAGHDSECALALRCADGAAGIEVHAFKVFSPVALAGIGHVPHTLEDRGIVVSMRRKTKAEGRTPFRRREKRALKRLRSMCVRWAADNGAAVTDEPVLALDLANDRAHDNWEVLCAVGRAVGLRWEYRAIETALHFATAQQRAVEENDDEPTHLLRNVREVIVNAKITHGVWLRTLADALNGLHDAPWADKNLSRGLSTSQLARLLRTFGLVAISVRIGAQVGKGYLIEDLEEPFRRYLDEPVTSVTASRLLTKEPVSHQVPDGGGSPLGYTEASSNSGDVTAVTERHGDSPPGRES